MDQHTKLANRVEKQDLLWTSKSKSFLFINLSLKIYSDPEHPQWNSINWKIFMEHTPPGDSEPKTTSLHCGSGCIVPDMKWRQYQV